MSYRIAAFANGPLAELAKGLDLPASLELSSDTSHAVWGFVDNRRPSGQEHLWAIVPAAVAALADRFQPRFTSVDDWLPGMTTIFERTVDLRLSISGEVSALYTSLAAPLKTKILGDIGLDLDLGIQAKSECLATGEVWYSIQRPSNARRLRLRLCAARASARSLTVKATVNAGLGQATRNAIAAILGQHRTQLLHQLRQGASKLAGKLPYPQETVSHFLNNWLAQPATTQAEQWADSAHPLLAAMRTVVDAAIDTTIARADELTARLEYAAVRTLEKSVEASLTAAFDRRQSTQAVLDAEFDFGSNPALAPLFQAALEGNLESLLNQYIPGLTIHRCVLATDDVRRHTFEWRLPFTSGSISARERIQTAMEALDDATGRIVRGYAKAESARRTRKASSLLAIEGAFAVHLGAEVTVHDPASCSARFELNLRTAKPQSLQPLLDLYHAGTAPARATACRMRITVSPEAIAGWLEPQDLAQVSRRMQSAWRTLLPLAVDLESINPQAAAPLLVWASLPVSTNARRTSRGVELNRPGSLFWDWADPQLLLGMIWNPYTRAGLADRLAHTPYKVSVDAMRTAACRPIGAAVLNSLLRVEAIFIDRLTSHLGQHAIIPRTPVEQMRTMSFTLAGLVSAFHGRLTSIYGPEAARALGPMLLAASSAKPPVAEVTWSR